MRPGRVEVYRELAHAEFPTGFAMVEGGWRWRHYAANGVQIGGSTESYNRLRDLSHNLEQCFPGYRLLDQNGALDGPHWFLCGLQVSRPEAYPQTVNLSAWPAAAVLGVGMRIHRIPVSVPAGVWLGSRR